MATCGGRGQIWHSESERRLFRDKVFLISFGENFQQRDYMPARTGTKDDLFVKLAHTYTQTHTQLQYLFFKRSPMNRTVRCLADLIQKALTRS